MLRSRKGRMVIILLSICVLAVGIYSGIICFGRQQPAFGLAIIVSFAVMFVCVLFLAVKGILDTEAEVFARTGAEKGRFTCGCEYRGKSVSGGQLVFYEKGFCYEAAGSEIVSLKQYSLFTHAVLDKETVMIFPAQGNAVLLFGAKDMLQAKAILSQLQTRGIEIR